MGPIEDARIADAERYEDRGVIDVSLKAAYIQVVVRVSVSKH